MDRGRTGGERRDPEGEAFERNAEKGGVVSSLAGHRPC